MTWISVEDRKPSHNESVGYVFDGKNIRNDVYSPCFNGEWEYENSLGYYVKVEGITHWMPYPETPKEEIK